MDNPYFIAIGPPKTGTTWLYKTLIKHPQIEMPPVKEIRYFWEKAFLGKAGLRQKLFSTHWHFRSKRKYIRQRIKLHCRSLLSFKLDWKSVKWDLKYFFLTHDDQWYLNLFSYNKISGDITPKYCELPEIEIESIKQLLPNLKIIISLRDPVERDWSRAKMNLIKKRFKNDSHVFPDEFIKHFKQKLQNKANDYVELVERWSKYFPQKNIFIFFQEQLENDSSEVFRNLCDFLEIDVVNIGDVVTEKFNRGVQMTIPSKYLKLLIELNLGYLEKMPDYFTQKYPKLWLSKYKSIVVDDQSSSYS